MRYALIILALFSILLFLPEAADAQCPMCKLAAEKNLEAGGSDGNGLNTGILYLLVFPYIIIGIIGYRVFVKNKESQTV